MKQKISLKTMEGILSRDEMKKIAGAVNESFDPGYGDGGWCKTAAETCSSFDSVLCCPGYSCISYSGRQFCSHP